LKFSKVSSTVILHSKSFGKLPFEKFGGAPPRAQLTHDAAAPKKSEKSAPWSFYKVTLVVSRLLRISLEVHHPARGASSPKNHKNQLCSYFT